MRSLIWVFLISQISLAIRIPVSNIDPFEHMHNEDSLDKRNKFGNLPPVVPPSMINDDNRSLKDKKQIPSYIIDHCPLVHLYSEEKYYPSDMKDFVNHFTLKNANGEQIVPMKGSSNPLDIHDLKGSYFVDNDANNTNTHIPSTSLYMTSNEDFTKDPEWLLGHPPEYGTGLIKKGPAVLFVTDKGNGWVDAYWFYFYPFNGGPYIMGYGPWGCHVGDWEHTLVRFFRGEPKYLWLSAHSGGTAYRYETVEKVKKLKHVDGKLTPDIIERPLIFSARGTHANYASVGQHPHDVPFFFMPLSDFTDRGPMWDPSLNFYSYIYDGEDVTPMSERESDIGLDWLRFAGTWGDKKLDPKDKRQKWCPVEYRYIDGPIGPLFKNLERTGLCQSIKWYNMWHPCPARRYLKRGNGLEAERNDAMGDNCGVLLYNIRPKWLRSILRLVMWRGVACFFMEYFTG